MEQSILISIEINWDEILKSKAPIIPVTENDIDVSNFEKENKKYLQSELENPFFHEKANVKKKIYICFNFFKRKGRILFRLIRKTLN